MITTSATTSWLNRKGPASIVTGNNVATEIVSSKKHHDFSSVHALDLKVQSDARQAQRDGDAEESLEEQAFQ